LEATAGLRMAPDALALRGLGYFGTWVKGNI